MSLTRSVLTVAKIVGASYRILATTILGYYLIKETIRKERNGRKYPRDG